MKRWSNVKSVYGDEFLVHLNNNTCLVPQLSKFQCLQIQTIEGVPIRIDTDSFRYWDNGTVKEFSYTPYAKKASES